MSIRNKILITIDVEDWFQVENLRPWFPLTAWDSQPVRVEQNTHRILDLLDSISLTKSPGNSTNSLTQKSLALGGLEAWRPEGNQKKPTTAKATFFVLGWVAKRLPNLVREIHNRGHEVASHGYSHQMCNHMEKKVLKNDLIGSKHLLEDTISKEVKGYRAPNFSVDDQILELIQKAGYRYDSSYNNFSRHGRYGQLSINGHKKQGIAIQYHDGFHEIPISNLSIGGKILPWGGGGYFRFMPLPVFKTGVRKILKNHNTYNFYLHPWEIDPKQPRVKASKTRSVSWRHYLNLGKTYHRLRQLISSFDNCNFITCSQYLELIT